MTNHLMNATSPYLLQHAHNPVDWYPWGSEAIAKARSEDKPIFLSIGYSACHWCHVMAHESFEDAKVADFMNQNFINIKVDREERPDLDGIYMSAVIALTGRGGWPMSVFLTPELVPFYGGTYFPSESRYGLPSFTELLTSIAQLWKGEREQILDAGKKLSSALTARAQQVISPEAFTQAKLIEATATLISQYDWTHGGWGGAPKFPQPMALAFLLRRAAARNANAIKPVIHALRMMARGGMYDVLGGGFSRYATDNDWLVPHFEKMLYDNAQLALVYLHAWQMTAEPFLRQVVEETLDFVHREMHSPEGGFYASLDADSEGVEGKFYVWTIEEIRDVLGGEDDLFEAAYGITANGNWEGKIILQCLVNDRELAKRFSLSEDEVRDRLMRSKSQLLESRNLRTRPGTDDKVLTSWNGLMLAAFAEAARLLDNDEYLQIAQKNADFLLSVVWKDGRLRRVWRNGQVSENGFLEDYGALILGLLDLYQTDFDTRWYAAAVELTEEMILRFSDSQGGFFDTPKEADQVLIRPKEVQDNATPSGSALAAEALLKLAAFTDNSAWRLLGEKALSQTASLALDHPLAFGRWLAATDFEVHPTRQIALIGNPEGEEAQLMLRWISEAYRPNTILAASDLPLDVQSPKLLADRPMIGGKTTAYVCEGFVCKRPVTTFEEFKQQLGE